MTCATPGTINPRRAYDWRAAERDADYWLVTTLIGKAGGESKCAEWVGVVPRVVLVVVGFGVGVRITDGINELRTCNCG